MNNDAANSRAISRSKLGLSRELQQDRTDLGADPSIAGTSTLSVSSKTHAYSMHVSVIILRVYKDTPSPFWSFFEFLYPLLALNDFGITFWIQDGD